MQAENKQLKQQLADVKLAKEQLLAKCTAKENRAPPRKATALLAGTDNAVQVAELQSQLLLQTEKLQLTSLELQSVKAKVRQHPLKRTLSGLKICTTKFIRCSARLMQRILPLKRNLHMHASAGYRYRCLAKEDHRGSVFPLPLAATT